MHRAEGGANIFGVFRVKNPDFTPKNHTSTSKFLFLFIFYFYHGMLFINMSLSGADPGFQVRGAHLKKLHRAEGGANFFWVFRVKNHDFTPKNHIFSNFRGGGRLDPPLIIISGCLEITKLRNTTKG